MLKQRVITALILGVIFIGSILFADTVWLSLLFTLVLFAATRELLALTTKPATYIVAIFSAVFALLFWWSLSLVNPLMIYWQSLAGVVLWIMIASDLFFTGTMTTGPCRNGW